MDITLKKYFLFFLFLIIKISVDCQNEHGLQLVTNAENYQIQERVLLTLDQDLYLAGEPVNFCALTFDAALKMPITFSSVLYVELFNQDNNVISTKKILLDHGECVNNLTLPRKLETGYYYVRAYTNYMKNFGPGAFFTKRIKIINPFYRINYLDNTDISPEEMKINVSAEGGKIVYGVENKIAFHLTKFNDSIHALLYKNDSVAAETNTKNGVGIFCFTPIINNRYRIEATKLKKGKAVVELKDIVQSGVICKLDSVNKRNAYLKVITKHYDKFPISLFVENNTIIYEYSNTISNPDSILKIELPVGLNKIILKNCNQEVVSERLIYMKPKTELEITANFDKQKAHPGDSVTLHINTNVNDSIHYIVALNLGNRNTSPAYTELMESTLFVTSLASYTGTVSSNELQTISGDPEIINDYILKFQNAEKINDKLKIISYLPEISHTIVSGYIRKLSDKSLAINKSIFLSFVDSICWINRSKTDSLGRFFAMIPLDYQGNNLIITIKDTTNNFISKLDEEFYPDFLKVVKEQYYPDSSLKDIIESRMINLQINDAYSEFQKITMTPRPTLRFYGYPDSEYKFKKYLVPNLEEFISEIEQKAIIEKNGKHLNIRVINKTGHGNIGNNPLIIFDGIPLLNTDNIVSIPSEKLESIRIVSKQFFFGSDVFDGIVDITSNTKSFDLVDLDRNSTRILFSPVITGIDKYQTVNSMIPDYISSIYFKNINSASGNEYIGVKLPQNAGKYSLSIVGYTKTGECGSISIPTILTISQ